MSDTFSETACPCTEILILSGNGGFPAENRAGVFTVFLSDGADQIPEASLAIPGNASITAGILETFRAFDSPDLAERILPALCAGFLSARFVHGLNNRLVGVVGNLDLASLYGWTGEKAAAAGEQARESALHLSEDLQELAFIYEDLHEGRAGEAGLGATAKASGRLVGVSIDWPPWALRQSSACMGASAACLLSISGGGRISGRREGSNLRLEWEGASVEGESSRRRPPVPFIIALASLAAFHNGGGMSIERWEDCCGSLVLRGDGGCSGQ